MDLHEFAVKQRKKAASAAAAAAASVAKASGAATASAASSKADPLPIDSAAAAKRQAWLEVLPSVANYAHRELQHATSHAGGVDARALLAVRHMLREVYAHIPADVRTAGPVITLQLQYDATLRILQQSGELLHDQLGWPDIPPPRANDTFDIASLGHGATLRRMGTT
ncbi:hypothetical protein EON66_06220, partial [archaeon]